MRKAAAISAPVWGLLFLLVTCATAQEALGDGSQAVSDKTGEVRKLIRSQGPETAGQEEAANAIRKLVRHAASNAGDPLSADGLRAKSATHGPHVKAWMNGYGESLIGTRGGPFRADKGSKVDYVTTHRGNTVYVHVLDWKDQNHVVLPPVIDQRVTKAWLLGDKPDAEYSWGLVRQSPWGLLVVVPNERRTAADTVVALELERDARELEQPRTVEAWPGTVLRLRGETARLEGDLSYSPSPDWIQGWNSADDQVTWKVRLPSTDDYEVALTYTCPAEGNGSELEINSPADSVRYTLRKTHGWAGSSQNFERRSVNTTLRLAEGEGTITLRLSKPSGATEVMKLHSLELISPAARQACSAARQRALGKRAKTDWFAKARYGLMVHWLPGTAPRSGPPKQFPEAVKDFDVGAFADMVKQSGASYLIFTAVHGIQWYPGPHQVYARLMPGRTCERDLVGDLGDALQKRGIKLIVYYHHGVGDHDWVRVSGFLRKDKSEFFKNEYDILTEIGRRYGTKVAGYWFDDRYPDQPFEGLFEATKIGNPDRIVAWNSWILPRSTEFQEYYAGEAGNILTVPDASYFAEGGPAEGLQPHFLIFADDPWAHTQPNSEIAPPLYTNDQLIRYVKDMNALGGPVTINIGVYQDGTASPATLQQLQTLRRAMELENRANQ